MAQATLSELVGNASRIHVVSHLNPDYDAYASLLFMKALLETNFPGKMYTMSVETEQPNQLLSFLPGFDGITFSALTKAIARFNPDLIIIVDAASVKRVTGDPISVNASLSTVMSALFDHHQLEDTHFNLVVNQDRFATVEVIYQYALSNDLTLPSKWEEYYLTGFIGDSYRFYYQVPTYRDSFAAIATILDHGYTIREFSDRLYGYSVKDLTIFKLLLDHLSIHGHYLFSYITWQEFKREIEGKLTEAEYKKARRYFIDEFMTKTYDTDFAVFIVPDDTKNDGRTYSGSIRAKDGTIDCPTIAAYLGGGGHTTGAGFTVISESIDEAQKQVFEVIQKTEKVARQTAKSVIS